MHLIVFENALDTSFGELLCGAYQSNTSEIKLSHLELFNWHIFLVGYKISFAGPLSDAWILF
jgi:hypothetical protein